MSTRCQIVVEGNNKVKIYKHSDGYPENVISWLEPLVKDFKEKRGFWDGDYLAAQIVYAVINNLKECHEKWKINYDFIGCGISVNFNGDEEYIYQVNKDWTISIFVPTDKFWNHPTFAYLKPYTPNLEEE